MVKVKEFCVHIVEELEKDGGKMEKHELKRLCIYLVLSTFIVTFAANEALILLYNAGVNINRYLEQWWVMLMFVLIIGCACMLVMMILYTVHIRITKRK